MAIIVTLQNAIDHFDAFMFTLFSTALAESHQELVLIFVLGATLYNIRNGDLKNLNW